MLRTSLEVPKDGSSISHLKSAVEPILKTVAACVTLGTGNSLGPEGPSVEIGASIAKGGSTLLDKSSQRKLSLRAAGSAAGISSDYDFRSPTGRMAATLAGVCQVPLTAVLLLFELTRDYRIVLPLLAAVGLSSLITSGQTRRRGVVSTYVSKDRNANSSEQTKTITFSLEAEKTSNEGVLCDLESSLCLNENEGDRTNGIAERILFSQAMRTRYVTVRMNSSLEETISLKLAEKQPCALVVEDSNFLIGLLALADIQQFSTLSRAKNCSTEELAVSEVCGPDGEDCQVLWIVTPNTDLLSAQILMTRHG